MERLGGVHARRRSPEAEELAGEGVAAGGEREGGNLALNGRNTKLQVKDGRSEREAQDDVGGFARNSPM